MARWNNRNVLGLLLVVMPAVGHAEVFGPYIGDVTENGASIVWRTDVPSSSVLELAEAGSPLVEVMSDPASVEQHELRVEGLLPGRSYSYRVRSEAGGQTQFESGPHTFRTAAPRGSAFSFVFLAEVHEEQGVAQFDSVITGFDPWFQAQPGDNIDDAGDLAQFESFFTQGSWYASVPLFNAFGNHNYQNDVGGLIPENTDAALSLELLPPHERYYTFRYGDTQFFALDSEHYLSDQVRDDEPIWFEQVLQEARDGVDDPALMVAFFHIPAFSSCGELGCRARKLIENPWVERELISRIEQYGVHLVLNGHDKINEHTIRNGVHYVQVSSGASPRDLGANNAGSQFADDQGLAVTLLTVDGCALDFDIVRPDGTVLHSATVTGDCALLPVDADADGSVFGDDCDDDDSARFPGSTEVCGDGVDQDCDGADEVCPAPDAGVVADTGAPPLDAGLPAPDAGVVVPDASSPDASVSAPPADSGSTQAIADDAGCGCRATRIRAQFWESALSLLCVLWLCRTRKSPV